MGVVALILLLVAGACGKRGDEESSDAEESSVMEEESEHGESVTYIRLDKDGRVTKCNEVRYCTFTFASC